MRPKDLHKEQAIIDKTLDIVSETGIAGIKMSLLAKRVGISPSTLYVYFETKEDLVISIGERVLKQMGEHHEKVIVSSESFKVRFKSKWIGMLNFLLNNQREVNFIEQWKQSPYFNKKAKAVFRKKKSQKNDLFAEGKELGAFKQMDEHIIFALMFGFSNQLITLINQGNLNLDKKVVDQSFNMVWDALKK